MKKKVVLITSIMCCSLGLIFVGCKNKEVSANNISAFKIISSDNVGDNITLTVVEYLDTGERYIITSQYQKPGSIIKVE